MKKTSNKTAMKTAICVAAMLCPSWVHAQALDKATVDTDASDTGDAAVETIVVTAQKRDENLQSVPISIAAVGGDRLERAGVLNPRDLEMVVPGVKAQGVVSPAVFIRGVGTSNASNTGDQGVALHLDGVFHARPTGFAVGFLDVERVEILKGPQGTLYGRGALGGNVNVISRAPSNDFEASVGVEFGNFDLVRVEGAVNLPVSEAIAIRAAVQAQEHDGYSSNGADDVDQLASRLRIRVEPTANLRLDVVGFYARQQGRGPAFHNYRGYPNLPRGDDPWDTGFTTDTQNLDSELKEVSAKIAWDMGFATLSYIPAYVNDKLKVSFPLLIFSPQPLVQSNKLNSKLESHEIRLDSATGRSFEWTLGAFHMKETLDYTIIIPPILNTGGTIETISSSLFGQASLRLGSRIKLIAGGRLTKEKKEQKVVTGLHFEDEWSPATGRLALQYEFHDDSMIYASLSTGFKGGGFFTAPPPNSFGPEKLRVYEVGSKNRFADGRLQLNVAAYIYKYDDYQVNALTPGFNNTLTQGVFNAGKVTMRGAEFDAIFRATPNDRFEAAVTYTHARFGEFAVPGASGRRGDQIPFSPDWSANVAYEHQFELVGGSLIFRLDSHLESSSWLTLNHRDATRQKGYTRSSASLRFTPAGENFSISAWIRSIENRAIKTSATDSLNLETYMLAPPRTFGLTLQAKF